MKLRIFLVSACSVALLFGCGNSAPVDPHAGHNHAPGEGHDEESATIENTHAEIVLPPEQAAELGVECIEIKPSTFTAAIHTSGMIEATPGEEASIVATASGVVSFSGRKTVVGTAIPRGGTLLIVNSSELTDDNLASRIADARAELTKSQTEFSRIEKLYREQLATASQMEQARLSLSTAEQAVERLTRNTSGSGATKSVTSPIGGYVTSLSVRDGDYVTQGQTVATVSSSRTVVLKADLPSRYFERLGEINSANFSTPYNKKVYDISQMGGRKLATARSAVDYTLPVRFEVENQSGLVAGTVVDVFLKTTPVHNLIAIPLTALTEEQGAFYIYLRLDEECYVKRAVRTGDSNGIDIVILDGLKAGETIVTKGAYFVRLASMSSAIPDGHSH